MQGKSGIRTAAIVAAAVVLVLGVIVLAYLVLGAQGGGAGIQLPDPEQTLPDTGNDPEQPEDDFASIRAENVLQVLEKTLTPADSFHQTLTLTLAWQDGSAARSAEIWHSAGKTLLTLQDAKTTRHYLTDGQTLYLWYDGDVRAAEMAPPEGSALEWIGIPDYLQNLQEAEILDAAFVAADESAGDRIYVRCRMSSGAEHRYWIDLESALLVRADILVEQQLTCQVLQQSLALVTPGDNVFEGVFCLPDGSDPFSH